MPDDDITKTSAIKTGATEATKAQEKLNQATKENSAAMKENIKEREQWNRLAEKTRKEQETLLGIMKKQAVEIGKQASEFAKLNHQVKSAGGAVTTYMSKLQKMSSVTEVYDRKLKAMRDGQKAYTGTLQATTKNIGQASAQSQKYVNAIHDSYANAHKIAGEFKIASEDVNKASEALSARFGTQLMAMDDTSGAMERMTRKAIVMSRYFGTDATAVMDMWKSRMDQSNMTLEQTQRELVLVAKEADLYAQSVEKLGKNITKTSTVGKKEFLKMVQDVGKELRTGVFDAQAYAKALGGVLEAGEKGRLTTEEQRVQAEGMKKVMGDLFDLNSDLGIFGAKGAQKIIQMYKKVGNLSFIADAESRKRAAVAIERSQGKSEITQIRQMMGAMKGNSELTAMAMEGMRDFSPEALQHILADQYMQGNTFIAANIAEKISSGELPESFREQAKQSKKDKDDQAKMWEKSIDDLVKAGATPKDLDYAMLARIEEIKEKLAYYVKMFPYWTLGAQGLGGLVQGLFGKFFKGAAGKVAAETAAGSVAKAGLGARIGAGYAATKGFLFQGARAGMGTLGGAGAVAGAGIGGWMLGRYLDKKIASALMTEEKRRQVGKDVSISGAVGIRAYDKETRDQITRIESAEYIKRKQLSAALEKEIKTLEKREGALDRAQQKKLDAMRSERKSIEKTIAYRRELEKKSKKIAEEQYSAEQKYKTQEALKEATTHGSSEEKARAIIRESFGAYAQSDPQKYLEDLEAWIKNPALLKSELGIDIKELGDPKELMNKVREEMMKMMLSRENNIALNKLDKWDTKKLLDNWSKSASYKDLGMYKEYGKEDQEAIKKATENIMQLKIGSFGSGEVSVPRRNAQGVIEIPSNNVLRIDGNMFGSLLEEIKTNNSTSGGTPK